VCVCGNLSGRATLYVSTRTGCVAIEDVQWLQSVLHNNGLQNAFGRRLKTLHLLEQSLMNTSRQRRGVSSAVHTDQLWKNFGF